MTSKKPPVLLLSVSNQQDRKLINSYLQEDLSIDLRVEKHEVCDFDLCIVDEYSFKAKKDQLKKIKEETAPVFLPIILLSKGKSQARADHEIVEFIDDVVYIPVSRRVLVSRIKLFLQQRSYSFELEEKSRQLAREKERYRLITENATDMVIINDPDGTFTYVSPSSVKLTGYTPDELLGSSIYDYFHPNDKDIMADARKILTTDFQNSHKVSFRFQTKKSGYKWVESNVRAVRESDDGAIKEIQGSVRDISHRKEYEVQLQKEKKFIDTVTESLPGIFFVLNEELSFVRWNDNFNDILEYSDAEIQNMGPTDFFEQKYQQTIYKKIKEVLREGIADVEVPIRTKSGKQITHYLIARTIERDNAPYIVGTGTDLSKRIAAENKLKESEQRWEKLVEKNPSLVQLTALDGTIRYVNPACIDFYGIDAPTLIGRNFRDFVSFDNYHQLRRRMVQVLRGASLPSETYNVSLPDGREGVILLQAVSVKHQKDQVLLTVAKDITERDKYEQRLKKSLREKKTLLQEIHHRVKNNLAVVSGMMQLQVFKTEDTNVQNLLSDSQKRIQTMALIHEKLYESESLSDIDFGVYVEDLIKYLQKVVSVKGEVQVDLKYDSFSLNVNQAVPSALIINEIVSNAFKHAFLEDEKGKITININEQRDCIVIEINDNGCGLPSDFEEIDSESMGFTIVKTLIEQLNANEEINSDDGFSFKLSFKKQRIKGSASAIIEDSKIGEQD